MSIFAPPFLVSLFAVFAAGLVIGSFLNVVILRGARGEGLGGRSRCDSCGTRLRSRELIPVVSFLWQKARCRSCSTALSWQYPLVEIATAIAFFFVAWEFFPFAPEDFWHAFLFFLAFPASAAVIVLVVSDFRFQILPDGAVGALAVFGFTASFARGTLAGDTAAALACAFFFAALWFFSAGKWMGFGDAKLIFATSLAVGFPASVAGFLFSFWLGGIAGVLLMALGRKGLQSRIPFGPFIIAGSVLAYFFSAPFLALTGLSLIF